SGSVEGVRRVSTLAKLGDKARRAAVSTSELSSTTRTRLAAEIHDMSGNVHALYVFVQPVDIGRVPGQRKVLKNLSRLVWPRPCTVVRHAMGCTGTRGKAGGRGGVYRDGPAAAAAQMAQAHVGGGNHWARSRAGRSCCKRPARWPDGQDGA